ncbi:hypothetical protein GCM10017083_49100 [Thalassobaculum fulvum]|uniref:DUF1499 domain-containing protein n=1 Tax=Thalassobaculum fulvum TaxID=1633335 RepID=A0A919CS91_9PROT|nr:hypothetical protein GCM10017083_49100 [Thalassobaculum fulvum]
MLGRPGVTRRPGTLAALLSAVVLAGCRADTVPLDLRTIARSGKPNDALACPPGLCRAAADRDGPFFELPVDQLSARVAAILSGRPRTELVAEDRDLHQLVFVQRSAVFGFPDTVRVQAVASGSGSALIVYSRSNYGHWDFGVNRARVERWLRMLVAG